MAQITLVTRGERVFFIEGGNLQIAQDYLDSRLSQDLPAREILDGQGNPVAHFAIGLAAVEQLFPLARGVAEGRRQEIMGPYVELPDLVTALLKVDPMGSYRRDHPELGVPEDWYLKPLIGS